MHRLPVCGGNSTGYVLTNTLPGKTTTNATGNILANTIYGNTGANIIEGLTGNDRLTGGVVGAAFLFAYHAGTTNTISSAAATRSIRSWRLSASAHTLRGRCG